MARRTRKSRPPKPTPARIRVALCDRLLAAENALAAARGSFRERDLALDVTERRRALILHRVAHPDLDEEAAEVAFSR